MTINPIKFAYEVNDQFIRYQLTAFPLSDEDLAQQAKNMIKSSPSRYLDGPFGKTKPIFAFTAILAGMIRISYLVVRISLVDQSVRFGVYSCSFMVKTCSYIFKNAQKFT